MCIVLIILNTYSDFRQIFYANNGTNMSAETALAQAWIAPSITPLTNLNSGFRVYEVDSSVGSTFALFSSHPTYFTLKDVRYHGCIHVRSPVTTFLVRLNRSDRCEAGRVTWTLSRSSTLNLNLVLHMNLSIQLEILTVKTYLVGLIRTHSMLPGGTWWLKVRTSCLSFKCCTKPDFPAMDANNSLVTVSTLAFFVPTNLNLSPRPSPNSKAKK